MILVHATRARLSVPRHDELGRGLVRTLINDAELTREEFTELVRKP
jgi:hypothetical protein